MKTFRITKTVCFMFVFAYLTHTSLYSQTKINPFLFGQKPSKQTINIAHRGARAFAPENTIPAFHKAIKMQADMFELDVQMTKDGVLIVTHDVELTTHTDIKQVFPSRKNYYVFDALHEDILKLDAGSWFVAELNKAPKDRMDYLQDLTEEETGKYISQEEIRFYQSGQVKIPTLEQVLILAKEHSFYVNIEIKSAVLYYPNIAEKVVALVQKLQMQHLVIISSFDHYQLHVCKKLDPNIPTAVLCAQRVYPPGEYCRKILQADAYNPGSSGRADVIGFNSISFLTTGKIPTDSIDNALDCGLGVNVWTVNEPEKIEILIQAKVTGIFSDYPNRVQQVLEKLSQQKAIK